MQCVEYAISTLNLPNVSMYLDAGHAGWLGWSANIGPAATLFAQVFKAAGSPAAVRGLATNVANYNAWTSTTCAPYTSGDANCDEEKYINALAPLLVNAGYPAHFIVEQCEFPVIPCPSSNFAKAHITQPAAVSSPPLSSHGATGATSWAPVSASAHPPTQEMLSWIPLSGSSPVENAMYVPSHLTLASSC